GRYPITTVSHMGLHKARLPPEPFQIEYYSTQLRHVNKLQARLVSKTARRSELQNREKLHSGRRHQWSHRRMRSRRLSSPGTSWYSSSSASAGLVQKSSEPATPSSSRCPASNWRLGQEKVSGPFFS